MKTNNKKISKKFWSMGLATVVKSIMRSTIFLPLIIVAELSQAATTTIFYHNDALGSPVAATDEDGELLWRKVYHPYGSEFEDGGSAANSNSIGYTGHALDRDTGLVYAGARYYDPNIGRFMGVDPVGFSSVNIQSFNRYVYGNNNPYKFVDPNGEWAVPAGAIVVGVGIWVALEATAPLPSDPDAIMQTTLPVDAVGLAYGFVKTTIKVLGTRLVSNGASKQTTVIGRMADIRKYSADDTIDSWAKSGRLPGKGDPPVTWAENKKWLQERIDRGDNFIIATNPKTLPPVKGGYIPGKPNGYFTARELEYLNKQGVKVEYKP